MGNIKLRDVVDAILKTRDDRPWYHNFKIHGYDHINLYDALTKVPAHEIDEPDYETYSRLWKFLERDWEGDNNPSVRDMLDALIAQQNDRAKNAI